METLILAAIPFFFLSMGLEALALRHAAHENREDAEKAGTAFVGYEKNDTRTSLLMGTGHLFIAGAWKLAAAALYAAIYVVSPFQLPTEWWTFVLLFFADDLSYYAFHRSHHRIRLFWATHVVHHSSTHFNLSTALRQDWSPFTGTLFWAPMALFFPPWMIFLAISWSLLYQFTLHTEAIDKYPRPIEWFWNTPSHHRVHHGSQQQYLDKNYAGILIIWDRMFGSFEPEGDRVEYGLTKNIETFNPVKVAYHEWMDIARDVRRSTSWRERLNYMFRGPGWSPEPQNDEVSRPASGSAPAAAYTPSSQPVALSSSSASSPGT